MSKDQPHGSRVVRTVLSIILLSLLLLIIRYLGGDSRNLGGDILLGLGVMLALIIAYKIIKLKLAK